MTQSSLQTSYREMGAQVGQMDGWLLPTSFGSPKKEYEALTRSVAVIDRSYLGRVEHRGSDALDLLHRITTNELASLRDGEARTTVMISEKGRVVDIFAVAKRTADRPLLLLTSGAQRSALLEKIDFYTIIEEAELSDISATTGQLTVAGPEASRLIERAAGLTEPKVGAHVSACIGGQPAGIVRMDTLGMPQFEVITSLEDLGRVRRALIDAGARPAGLTAYESRRVELGVAAPGLDADDRVNPLEANLGNFIDFEKGCYIGQEVVARLDTYDKVQRRLTGLLSHSPLPGGAKLTADGRAVGWITSTSHSIALDRPVGLGYLRRGYLEPGAELMVDGDGQVIEVGGLPLVP